MFDSVYVPCPNCGKSMRYWKSIEKRLGDGIVHYMDEYVCLPCDEKFSIDLGPVVPEK